MRSSIALFLLACNGDKTKTPGGGDDSGGPDDTDTPPSEWECVIPAGDTQADFAQQIGCAGDFDILASQPLDASIPGARSIKTVIDRIDNSELYFQNSNLYQIHWEFASAHLSGNGLPIVPELGSFNLTEYYSPDRRFVLGAVTHYEGPGVYAYEISPYDTADAEMITEAYRLIAQNVYFGEELYFHPTSTTIEGLIDELPEDVKVITTDELYAGIDYQPLNFGTTTGLLRFYSADEVDGNYTPYRELVVLDAVPNDISIVAGIITAEFQTPLSHINVLSANRGTPNMGLRDAQAHPDLLALEGKWVHLTVDPFEWEIYEITEQEAADWWEENKPDPLTVQPMDLTVTDLRDCIDMMDLDAMSLREAIDENVPVFGAKATNYGGLEEIQALGEPINVQPAFGVPMYYYDKFMMENGFWDQIEAMMAEKDWEDPAYRSARLEEFQELIRAAPMDPDDIELITAKVLATFPEGQNARFRSSTNSEDLGDFTGAGLYTSETGDPDISGSGEDSIEWAIKKVYASIWNPRAYEERNYYSINHLDVGMALLVTPNFPEEEANGVAITNNIFDTSGLEPAFYINAQEGNGDVVLPEEGVLPDSILYFYYTPGQPSYYMQHSTEVPDGETVLTEAELYELGQGLDAVHRFFYDAYGADGGWYGMDVEWKFDDKYTPGDPIAYIKQARPYPAPDFDAGE